MEKRQQTKDYFRELMTLLPGMKLLNILHSQSHKQVCTFSINTKTFKSWELEVSKPVQIFHMDPVFFNINKYKQTTFCRLAAGQQRQDTQLANFDEKQLNANIRVFWYSVSYCDFIDITLTGEYHLCFGFGKALALAPCAQALLSTIHYCITISQHTNTFIVIH